ncbi:hypothetical protein LTR95_010107 [Oleoguttula sp. CCFEE 5521]
MTSVTAPEATEDVNFTQAPDGVDTSQAEAALKAKLSRKRTKSGCLTCRKRRIKCGEERMVCKNCIKSKRHCEGYSQRVVFKPPNFLDYQAAPNGGAHIVFQAMPGPGQPMAYQAMPNGTYAHDPGMYTQLRPRPLDQPVRHVDPATYQHVFATPQQQMHGMNGVHGQGMANPSHMYGQQVTAPSGPPMPNGAYVLGQPMHDGTANAGWTNSGSARRQSHVQYQIPPHVMAGYNPHLTGAPPQPAILASNDRTPAVPSSQAARAQPRVATNLQPRLQPAPQTPASTRQGPQKPWEALSYTPRPELSRPIDLPPSIQTPVTYARSEHVIYAPVAGPAYVPDAEYHDFTAQPLRHHTPTQLLTDAAVEVQDDDYYDVQSDEEMEFESSTAITTNHRPQRMLQRMLHNNRMNEQNMQIRRYDTFLENGMLDHYRVDEVANPLRNPATARVFAHFISATGPSLSTFERHPVSSSVLFTEGSVPFSQQGLWTYTMPMAALRNQGLLHAMLALASLHIARLQGGATTPSLQHYMWSLKRIHKSVGSKEPKRRLQVTTIAASMLLGFYELMTADHVKWNRHLAGAKQLFVETDFIGMTRQFRRMKREKWANEQQNGRRNSIFTSLSSGVDLLDQMDDVDETMVSRFVGRQVRYDDAGHFESPRSAIPEELDIAKFEILKDLFWWYAKQDAYQSVVSGNALLMDYSRWADCPPRAPLGRPDAIYGSFDHLILLLGRIADFSSRDRARKLKQMEQNGGQWIPAPGMNIPRPPQPPPTSESAAPPPPQAGPMFFGMAPPPRTNVQMPASYNPAHYAFTPKQEHASSPIDLRVATEAALAEYGRIRAALQEYAAALNIEAFQPLGPDLHMPFDTPFGPAKTYQRYDIALLWAVYNMAVIIAIRSHPHMHPAAHAAAAIAAPETAFFANEIGAITAGMNTSPANQPLNPTLGAALSESCMPSFFAAVQYMRPDQRHDTAMRIYGIALRTGWGSAELIANGCETAWVKAAEAIPPRGPPYTRVLRPQSSDDPRLNGSWERVDPNSEPEAGDEGDRRFLKSKPNARLNWAVGVLGTEEDVKA